MKVYIIKRNYENQKIFLKMGINNDKAQSDDTSTFFISCCEKVYIKLT